MTRSPFRAAPKLLVIVWLCFLIRGSFYSALLPIWEGYDEPSHFSFIRYIATHHSLPTVATPVSREVEASLHVLPLSWEQRLHALPPPIYTEDSYWQLDRAAREELQRQARSLPPSWGSQTGTAPTMYEAQQAPLCYWIMSGPLRLASGWRLGERVMLVRLLSVLIASLLLPIAWMAAEDFFSSSPGWYMCAVVLPEVLLVAYGLYQVSPQPWRWIVLPTMATAFAAIDLYGGTALLMPYYTGLIAHVPGSDAVHPARLGHLIGPAFSLMMARLTANRPPWLGSCFLIALLLLYYAATLVPVAIAFRMSRAGFNEPHPAARSPLCTRAT